ncbi:phosphoglucosamine mutase [Jatrophihabitans lederbergiae]|uniref:Phosphoglucosamine mutase n=1 Tax=Jatrophihabitans lederbergiae TaxID=3075547 RepID=A0ABU2J6H2_9ACTN|nr:phosphoglucosamine mutase [Jatrophihabitans sp. DSM 44399]MDT0260199.1 phosphoglucosamine mutase [Jatrophihabitans sp. DSM 44399]
MSRYFGTDGVRGRANTDLTPELALAVASAAARVLASHDPDASHRPFAVLGRDPRASSEMLEAAVAAGLTSAGADVRLVGVLPTPAVAYLTQLYGADLGVVLSASHNPMPDNGVKLFARGGQKLPDDIEAEIEAEVDSGWTGPRPTGASVGRITVSGDGAAEYAAHLLKSAPASLAGLKVVVDCAHGAASSVAGDLFASAGADVVVVAGEPDGLNINDGVGSTHIHALATAVLSHSADLGVALDGDADRCLAVDATGAVVDGDQILAICAKALKEQSLLAEDTVVATVMSNLGFHHAMRDAGIDVLTTAVGDRYVLEALTGKGLSLGGEQSGHVIFTDAATTGDGLLTALRLMGCMAAEGRSLAELATVVQRLPQVMVNVRVADRASVSSSAAVQRAVAEASAELGDEGRILLRPSGTEQLIRVMVEAATQDRADAIAHRVADVVRSA